MPFLGFMQQTALRHGACYAFARHAQRSYCSGWFIQLAERTEISISDVEVPEQFLSGVETGGTRLVEIPFRDRSLEVTNGLVTHPGRVDGRHDLSPGESGAGGLRPATSAEAKLIQQVYDNHQATLEHPTCSHCGQPQPATA